MSFLPNVITAAGATTARTLAASFADWNNVKSFGAVGDGTTVDLAALTGTPSPAFLPKGTFYTGSSIYSLTGNHRYAGGSGGGLISTLESAVVTKQSPNVAIISTQPTAGGAGFQSTFSGDMSNVHLAFQTKISGTALTAPGSTYVTLPGLAGIYGYGLNSATGTGGAGSGTGRTGFNLVDMHLAHSGDGDGTLYFGGILVTGPATPWGTLAGAPAGSFMAGTVKAAGSIVALYGIGDLNLVDGGFDVAGYGITWNFTRTVSVNTTLGWMAVRPQSRGTVAIDAMYSGVGLTKSGLDLTGMQFQTPSGTATYAGVAMAANTRLYANSTNTDATKYAQYTALGTEWYEYDATQGHRFVVGSAQVLGASAAGVAIGGAGSYGGGTGVVFIANDSADPTTNPVGGGILYVKAGALTYRGSSGTVTVLGPA